MTERVLDWRPGGEDIRSRLFGVRQLIGFVDRKVKLWRAAQRRTDQGYEGACVGHGWTNELMALPTSVYIQDPNPYAYELYREAQTVDVWPGENYEGTSVLGGARVVNRRGFLDEYRWAYGIDDVIDTLVVHGPLVVGTEWYDSMYEPRPSSLVEVGGSVVGGHCYLLTGYHPKLQLPHEPGPVEAIRFRNSWGPTYGYRGDAWITVTDFDRLMAGAEACVPVKRVKP